ncbi:MAG: enoyl-CoA hydratase/isomerase family protein [Ferruginibacter sp.]|nr:enoyl-CoA hydratase/isomerase family protein [Cytophagales bacterium]
MLYTEQQVRGFHQHRFAFLVVDQSGHVLTLTLNRPEKKNAMNAVLTRELAFALEYAHHQSDVRVVVVDARGDVFCAGADLKAFAGESPASDSTVPVPVEPIRLGDVLAGLHKPSIAKVHAPVYAGGFLLVGGCTHVIASENATFSLPEVRRGIFPFQVLATLMRLMPARLALDLCLRARTLSASEAQRIGLATTVVPASHLEAEVRSLVGELLQGSPTAIQMGLRAYQEMQRLPADQQHAYLQGMLQEALKTEDAAEGIAAFAQKRPPEWKG